MQMPLKNLEKGLRIIARSRKQNKTKTFTQFTIVVITTKSDSRQNQIRNKTRVKILNSFWAHQKLGENSGLFISTRTFSGPFFAHFRTSQAYSLARGLGQNQRSQQPISCSDICAKSACLQCMSSAFDWRNCTTFQPFLTSNRHFWQMTQMSDKCLLSKTEKLGYLDKLRLSESAETSGQNAYCTGFAVHTRLVCFSHHKKYDIFLLVNEIIQDRIQFRGSIFH